ncbi:nucleoside triphosphate pyrophosphohydrolase family protein [Paracoccus sp. 11-3]|uniref:Nucleoside triphosphate pyrophosphohydrolase family protein n=1 Tax=Paracoccus amoyensis TaxID=2760093 RepID=A0A926J6C1_9RHOB|nr:nucleoside triphosphate pyrophosphohydrolase family protein [Paracoccus amoyensis]MBC9247117.1 nucleoside triphosphate pyrophosphohydrolase family protein [Paracoccus amoyensis]
MLRDTLSIVREWHDAFDVPVQDAPAIPDARVQMRLAILEEEVAELRAAAEAGDMVEVLDALCDIQYVLDGTFLEFGLHGVKDQAMAEVHASNMSKLGADGRPVLREDGKVLKGPSFFPPDLVRVLAEQGRS